MKTVIASEAKQSMALKNGSDCFVASLPCANVWRLSRAMTTRVALLMAD